uniref:Triosephosphate isomerase n=1 Tax=uncultured organism TaxID=155900 RepID=M1PV31_9ZZZZ|nr:triosephosphate isomerase [uncultured organism]
MITMLETPIIIVNYKTYGQSVGKRSVELTKTIEKNKKESWAVCPQTVDMRMVSEDSEVPVLAQHIDAIEPGSHTGHTLLKSVKEAGATGTLINHSEKRLKLSDIEKIVNMCKEEGLDTIVCANNPEVAAGAAALSPDFVAYEPPELIGGDISVSTGKPELIEEAVRKVKKVDGSVEVLCGAGVKNGDDVKKALELGTEGVLLASGLVKADDPVKVIEDLESGIE